MKKNLIAMAVAALVAPVIASAEDDVTVYGMAQVEVASIDPQGDRDTYVDVVDNARGRLGVVATEDLGSGLKGLAKFEFKLDTADGNSSTVCENLTTTAPELNLDTNGDGVADAYDHDGDGTADALPLTGASCSSTGVALTSRELFVGLKGGFGQVELGRLKSAYKYAGGVAYDPFVTTTLEARKNGGMSKGDFGHTGFVSKSVGYNSPKLGPVGLRVTYAPSEDDSAYTASAKAEFKMGEVIVALADQGDRAGKNEYSAWKVGGQLRLAGGAHKLALQYEGTEQKDATKDPAKTTKPTFVFAGYQGTFGKSTFVAQFGLNDSDVKDDPKTADKNESKDITYYALGAIYKFSKNTRVFGGYRVSDVDDDSGQSVISIGMRKDFK
ncbi:MAG: porin [Gammaproteobacteria bacterium]|jgi:predicted porin